MKNVQTGISLSNGVKIPCVGFGTWQLPGSIFIRKNTVKVVRTALEAGYRHIDTASVYGNEREVGWAVLETDIPRRDIFVTSKVWNLSHGYKKTLIAFRKSLRRLKLNYIDLYLIHWPCDSRDNWKEKVRDTWRAMEELYDKGLVKAIGVSNFKKQHIEALLETAKIKPMVNQIELHPGKPQDETVTYCSGQGILVEGYSPLGRGRILVDEALLEISKRHKKSPAQICLRWAVERGVVPLPKASSEARILENTEIFDFELTKADLEVLETVGKVDVLRRNKD